MQQYIGGLPDYHQEVLASFDWLQICAEIAGKYRLSGKQEEAFMLETLMLVFQVVPAELYKTNLMNNCAVSEMIAYNLMIDVKNRIIDRLQTELTRVVGETPDIIRESLQNSTVAGDQLLESLAHQQLPSQVNMQTPLVAPSPILPASTQGVTDPYHESIE